MAVDKPLHLFSDTRALRIAYYSDQTKYTDMVATSAGGLTFSPLGTERFRMANAGIFHIGDTTNANMTIGLTVNQAGNDDEAAAFKSSDVAHGMTSLAETDSYGTLKKQDSSFGGLLVQGYGSDIGALELRGNQAAATAVRTTGAQAPVTLDGRLKTGTTVGSVGADKNLCVIRDNGTARFIFDSDGDSHQDVGTAWTNFDAHDDVAVLNTLAAHVTRRDDPLRDGFRSWLERDRGELERLRLVSFNDGPDGDGRPFVNMSRLTMLHTGAIRQVGGRAAMLADALRGVLVANPGLHGADRALALLGA